MKERSHYLLEREIADIIPAGSTVAVDPSAYFACVANRCQTYYRHYKFRGAQDDRLRERIRTEFVIRNLKSSLWWSTKGQVRHRRMCSMV